MRCFWLQIYLFWDISMRSRLVAGEQDYEARYDKSER
jgi:hypothetical protein